jgi:hypothetical protein
MTYEVTEAVSIPETPAMVFNPETGSFEAATETEACNVTDEGIVGDVISDTIH